jgi:hypothetical protein
VQSHRCTKPQRLTDLSEDTGVKPCTGQYMLFRSRTTQASHTAFAMHFEHPWRSDTLSSELRRTKHCIYTCSTAAASAAAAADAAAAAAAACCRWRHTTLWLTLCASWQAGEQYLHPSSSTDSFRGLTGRQAYRMPLRRQRHACALNYWALLPTNDMPGLAAVCRLALRAVQ